MTATTPKIFATGVTGYVGGDALYVILAAHPDWEPAITCLVRDPQRGAALLSRYPYIKIAHGSIWDLELMAKEAAKADIVMSFVSSDDVPPAEAIAKGLATKGGFWIHSSGTDVLTEFRGRGQKTYDDWEGIGECLDFPDDAPHRPVDKVVLEAGSEKVKVAIVCPATVYGVGRGPGSTRSHQVYNLAQHILESGQGIKIGSGDTFWNNIHVYDLSNLYLAIVEAAAAGGGTATWNDGGYYLMESGEHNWNVVALHITREAERQGVLSYREQVSFSREEPGKLASIGVALWNSQSKAKTVRAKKLFGWAAQERSLLAEVPDIVRSEAKRTL